MNQCILCGAGSLRFCHHDGRREYLACPACALVQVPARYWLSAEAEKAVYDLHENDPYDAGYRRFLGGTADLVCRRHPPGSSGLDFGCGPGPALIRMLEEQGYRMAGYDVWYQPGTSVLEEAYHFITATEVLEHLHNPIYWLDRLWQLLQPGGSLVVQTKRVTGDEHLAGWHYLRDQTHIHFFAVPTFRWLGQRYGAKVALAAPDVAALYKPDSPG